MTRVSGVAFPKTIASVDVCCVQVNWSILAGADAGSAKPAKGKPLAAVVPARWAVLDSPQRVGVCSVMVRGQFSCAGKEGGPDQGPKGGPDSGC